MPPVAASSMTLKRITREMADLRKEDMGHITLTPSPESMFNWTASLPGPEGSPYEGGEFHLHITLPSDYPFSAPRVLFTTRIYHMNVSSPGGQICIDILKSSWSAALSLYKVILSISSLLTDPNPNDPLVPGIAEQYRRNRSLHDATAREWTRNYAKPKPKPTPAPAHDAPAATAESSRPSSSRASPAPPLPHTRTIRGGSSLRPPAPTENDELIDLSSSPPPPPARATSATNPIEISSSPEPETAPTRKRKRRDEVDVDLEVDEAAPGPSRRRRPNGGSGGGAGEVIVVD